MRAFTLIEMLAVVMLLGIVASVATVSLAGASDQAGLQSTIAVVRDADARARLLARSGGSVSLSVPDGHEALVLTQSDGNSRVFSAGKGARVHLVDAAGDPITSIRIDTRGRSPEYAVVIQLMDQATVVRFAGLTGWSEVERRTDP